MIWCKCFYLFTKILKINIYWGLILDFTTLSWLLPFPFTKNLHSLLQKLNKNFKIQMYRNRQFICENWFDLLLPWQIFQASLQFISAEHLCQWPAFANWPCSFCYIKQQRYHCWFWNNFVLPCRRGLYNLCECGELC